MFRLNKLVFLILVTAATGAAVWAALHFAAPKWFPRQSANDSSKLSKTTDMDAWARAVEKVKEVRVEPQDGSAAVVTPPELRHYSDRHWFLATQVAEIAKYGVHTCQDYVDLAAMIERRELVAVPAVTDTYVLYGVGEKADEDAFSRYHNDESVDLYDEAQLSEAYRSLEAKRSNLQSEIKTLQNQSAALKKRDRAKRSELQKQSAARQQELNAANKKKARLDQVYGHPESREKLIRDYQSLKALARTFAERSYNIDEASDRQAMKLRMLRSLRPEALKIMEEIAAAYHRQFDRPLPVSSLVRPEEYQHELRKVNRNAVLIETPPHSTGLAFDIDYRYMSAAEQTFVMAEIARLKGEGRVEAIRERNANYHVFVFVSGTRPDDDLITASLEKAGAPVDATHHASKKSMPAKTKAQKAQKAKGRTAKSRKRR